MLNIIIPARSGSKGITKKNIQKLNGKELVKYTLEAAEKFFNIMDNDCRIIFSSDSQEILDHSNEYDHVECHLRDVNLATDKTLTVEVVVSIINSLKINSSEYILLLQPTVPNRPLAEIREIKEAYINMITTGKYQSLVSLSDVGGNHPFRFQRLVNDALCIPYIDQGFEDMRPRQDLPKCYIRSGSYYLNSVKNVINYNSLVTQPVFGYCHTKCSPINIDTILDFKLAEIIINEGQNE